MRSYLEISVTATTSQRELLIPTMTELGCRGLMETDTALLCYFDKTGWTAREERKLESGIKQLLRTISSNAAISLRTIPEENWNAQWERTIQPIEIGQRIVVKPSWADYEQTSGKIIIQINPKMSFGTGYHETTRLMLRMLDKYVNAGCSILDIGTGTGILAIAAVKLGAERAVGIDNDPWSIANASENARANGVERCVTISNRPLSAVADRDFDMIATNITMHVVIEMLPEMIKRLKPTGILLISGLFVADEQPLALQLNRFGLSILEKLVENEWLALAAG